MLCCKECKDLKLECVKVKVGILNEFNLIKSLASDSESTHLLG